MKQRSVLRDESLNTTRSMYGCKNDAKQEENGRFGRMGRVPPLQNRILGKNVISHDSPGIVEKKKKSERKNRTWGVEI